MQRFRSRGPSLTSIPPAVGRVLDGVADKVREHLPQLVGVGCDCRYPRRGDQLESQPFRRVSPGGLDHAPREFGGVDASSRKREVLVVEPAREEDVVHDGYEALGLLGDDLEQMPARLFGGG